MGKSPLEESSPRFKWDLGLFAPSVSQLTPAQTIALLTKSNYRWVEWRVQTLEAIESSPWGKAYNTLALDHLQADVVEVASLLEGSGIKVTGLQVDLPEGLPGAPQAVLEAARLLDCPRVLLTSPGYDPCVGYRVQREMFRSRLSSWVDVFNAEGIRICIETHFNSITPSSALALDVLQTFDPAWAGVMWDPANTVCEGSEIPAMGLDLLDPYLAEVHLKNGAWTQAEDGKWTFNFCDLSAGMVQWPTVLRLLDEQGYSGPLVVEDYRWTEPESKLAQARTELEKAIHLAREAD
jgi:sugar phosphate isomerase/epimerase